MMTRSENTTLDRAELEGEWGLTEEEAERALSEGYRLSCMEVWGGNETNDALVRTSGLDVYTSIRPYGEYDAGGDVLYVTACSSGRITRAMLADVVGHGADAAETAGSLRRIMASAVNILDQSRLVRTLNEEFAALRERGRFASAVVASYFRPTGVLAICNAGHPPPFYYSASREAWMPWTADSQPRTGSLTNLPLGIFGSVDYDLLKADLEPGDRVLIYTDGVIEAYDAQDRQVGVDGLQRVLDGLGSVEGSRIIPEVTRAVESWAVADEPADDMSMMLLERNELSPGLRDQILAPARYLKHLVAGSV